MPEYYELSARLAWQANPKLSLAVNGFNLLHDGHREYPAPSGEDISRSVFAQVRFDFQSGQKKATFRWPMRVAA